MTIEYQTRATAQQLQTRAYIIATIIAATIISYAAIGQARAERDSYNHQYILLQDSIARTSV